MSDKSNKDPKPPLDTRKDWPSDNNSDKSDSKDNTRKKD